MSTEESETYSTRRKQQRNPKYRHRHKERHSRKRGRKNKGSRRKNRKPLSLDLSNEDLIPLQPPQHHEHRHFEKQELVKNKTLKLLDSLVGGAARILAGKHELHSADKRKQTLNERRFQLPAGLGNNSSSNNISRKETDNPEETILIQSGLTELDPVTSHNFPKENVSDNYMRTKKNNAEYSHSYGEYGSDLQPSWFSLANIDSVESSSQGFVTSVETKKESGLLSSLGSKLVNFLGLGTKEEESPTITFKNSEQDSILGESEASDVWGGDYDFLDSLLYDGSGSGERGDDVSEWSTWSSCNATCGRVSSYC